MDMRGWMLLTTAMLFFCHGGKKSPFGCETGWRTISLHVSQAPLDVGCVLGSMMKQFFMPMTSAAKHGITKMLVQHLMQKERVPPSWSQDMCQPTMVFLSPLMEGTPNTYSGQGKTAMGILQMKISLNQYQTQWIWFQDRTPTTTTSLSMTMPPPTLSTLIMHHQPQAPKTSHSNCSISLIPNSHVILSFILSKTKYVQSYLRAQTRGWATGTNGSWGSRWSQINPMLGPI